jgi:hypothetical protein
VLERLRQHWTHLIRRIGRQSHQLSRLCNATFVPNVTMDSLSPDKQPTSKKDEQLGTTNRSDRVDEVVPTGRLLPAGWHSRCESNVKEIIPGTHICRGFCAVFGESYEEA